MWLHLQTLAGKDAFCDAAFRGDACWGDGFGVLGVSLQRQHETLLSQFMVHDLPPTTALLLRPSIVVKVFLQLAQLLGAEGKQPIHYGNCDLILLRCEITILGCTMSHHWLRYYIEESIGDFSK